MDASVEVKGLPAGNALATKERFYQPELDALRFFAFLCVFVHHTGKFSASAAPAAAPPASLAVPNHDGLLTAIHGPLSAGVSLFFFLSAYLITTLLLLEIEKTGTVDVPAFYIRRGLRIWPLYFTYVFFVVCLGQFVVAMRMPASEVFAFLAFYGNWYCVLHAWQTVSLVGMLWSISIEEQFYLVCPVIVGKLKAKGLVGFSIVGAVISCGVLLWFGARAVTEDSLLRPNTLVQMLFFVGGTIAAVVLRGRRPGMPLWLRPLLLVSGIYAWVVGFWQFDSAPLQFVPMLLRPLLHYGFVLLGVVLLFSSFLGLESRYIPRWVAYLGKISYGLYIWHMLAFWLVSQVWWLQGGKRANLAGEAVALGLTITIASASYAWLEKPFLKFKSRFSLVKSREA